MTSLKVLAIAALVAMLLGCNAIIDTDGFKYGESAPTDSETRDTGELDAGTDGGQD